MKKAIVLLSGGIDSSTVLYIAKAKGYKPACLTFDYGQKNKKEIEAAGKVAKKARSDFHIVRLELPWRGSSLLERTLPVPNRKRPSADNIPSTYVPARNIIFLSLALSFAEAGKAEAVFIGAHTQDYSGYPDCRPSFLSAFRKAASLGTRRGAQGRPIKIFAPLLDKSKSDIIKIGAGLEVPYGLTWSCYRGGRRPCLRCDSCFFRRQGFFKAGLKDPIYEKG